MGNVSWRCMRAEDLPADLPSANVITLAQSFHWMDRPRVAAAARRLLAPSGVLIHVSASTQRGVSTGSISPPWGAINRLVEQYLGPKQAVPGDSPGNENVIYRSAGFSGPCDMEIPGCIVQRSAEEIAASVYSLSRSTPHLFGSYLPAFDRDLRALLSKSSDEFTERTNPIVLHLWR